MNIEKASEIEREREGEKMLEETEGRYGEKQNGMRRISTMNRMQEKDGHTFLTRASVDVLATK